MVLIPSYNPWLVVLSVAIAVIAAYVSFSVTGRLARSQGWTLRVWWLAGALAMGWGVWAMHFVGMLAFHPGTLAVGITVVSLLLLGVLAAAWLHARVEHGVQHRDQTLARTREMLIERMYHDDLTGLPNRTLLLERLQRSLADAERNRRTIALLVLELKGFKMVNDWLGHEAGDQALRAIAASLQALVPEAGMVARLGGDEFAIAIDRVCDAAAVERLCRQVLAVMRQPVSAVGYPVSLQPSVGVAISTPGGDDAGTLLRNADAAMQAARQHGDTGYRLFEKGMHRDARERLTLTLELREAIRTGVLQAYFQPAWDLRSGALVGAEALARWVHPQRGQVSPTVFVPLAEADGMAGALGAAMLDQVLGHLRSWLAEGLNPGPVAINLSLYELRDAGFIDGLRDKLEAYQVPAGCLHFEITESVAMGDLQATLARLHAIRALGCGLLIDDFGTGYSSLSHLRHLPIEAIKIDQSFVRDAQVNQADRDITEAIVALAKRLRLKIIAEGVETEAQARWLREIGCDVVQGFLYARPLPAADYAARLRAARDVAAPRARALAPVLQMVRAP